MSETRRMWHLVRHPRRDMPSFLHHPPAVHLTFARCVVPWIGVRSVAILLRSCAQGAFVPGAILAVAALALQLLTWACFGWFMVWLTCLGHCRLTERQAFALSTAVSAPLWLGGIFYLVPEDPPALFVVGRLAVVLCGAWGGVLLAYARWAQAPARRRRQAFLVAASLGYVIIYTLFFATTGLAAVATLFAVAWSG